MHCGKSTDRVFPDLAFDESAGVQSAVAGGSGENLDFGIFPEPTPNFGPCGL